MSKHTPGPWVVYELVDGYDIRAPEAECWVVTASDPEAAWGAIGREEDACLMAAAPEMLEALEKVISEYIKSLYNSDRALYLGRAMNAAEKTIAKAKGEEHG